MASEDFDNYTEVDPTGAGKSSGHIQWGDPDDNHIDFTPACNEDAYLYLDKGANHFGDFTHLVTVQLNSVSDNFGRGIVYSLTVDTVDDWYGLISNNKTAIGIRLRRESPVSYRLYLEEIYNGTFYADSYVISLSTPYYLTIDKAGTALTCKIYSDAARTNLLDTLQLNLHADHKFRYVMPCNTYHSGTQTCDIDIDDLDLQEGEQYRGAIYQFHTLGVQTYR